MACCIAAEGAKLFIASLNKHCISGIGIPFKRAEWHHYGHVPDSCLATVEQAGTVIFVKWNRQNINDRKKILWVDPHVTEHQ